MERHIDINRYDYDLPEERIAKFPLAERSASKLLVYRHGEISERHFADIGEELPAGQLLVFNNTKVIRARIIMHKPSGARIEVFCLEPCEPADYERAFAVKGSCEWSCIVGNLKKWKEGYVEINFDHEGRAEYLRAWRVGEGGREQRVRFEWSADMTFGQLLETLGRIPIPPYLNRESEEIDNTRYQTVYSKFEGSVAAPTAGLHFTEELIGRMKARGFEFEEVTLHVGAGTFLPVKDDDAARHPMHTEHFEVRRTTVARLLDRWGDITAVGTTSVRSLESAWDPGVAPSEPPVAARRFESAAGVGDIVVREDATTNLYLMPGSAFHVVDAMITNFHVPRSTLMMLVSAFATRDQIMAAYSEAIEERYRFLSFGDAMLIV